MCWTLYFDSPSHCQGDSPIRSFWNLWSLSSTFYWSRSNNKYFDSKNPHWHHRRSISVLENFLWISTYHHYCSEYCANFCLQLWNPKISFTKWPIIGLQGATNIHLQGWVCWWCSPREETWPRFDYGQAKSWSFQGNLTQKTHFQWKFEELSRSSVASRKAPP